MALLLAASIFLDILNVFLLPSSFIGRAGSDVTSWTLVNAVAALLFLWGHSRGRVAYSCPICGSKRADAHDGDCPWNPRP